MLQKIPFLVCELATVKGDNGHLKQARDYLASGKLTGPVTCLGCHVK
jgi:hypothetical protein